MRLAPSLEGRILGKLGKFVLVLISVSISLIGANWIGIYLAPVRVPLGCDLVSSTPPPKWLETQGLEKWADISRGLKDRVCRAENFRPEEISEDHSPRSYFQQLRSFAKKPFTVRHKKKFRDIELFDVRYSFDATYRRILPANPEQAQKFVFFTGGSFTMGEGVGDAWTFANQYVSRTQGFRGYIVADRGYGPNDVLFDLQNPVLDRLKGIKETSGLHINLAIRDHLYRMVGSSFRVTPSGSWMLGKPRYSWNGETLKYEGRFYEEKLLNALYTVFHLNPVFAYRGIQLPLRLTSEQLKIYAQMLVQTTQEIRRRGKNVRAIYALLDFPAKEVEWIRNEVGESQVLDLSKVDFMSLSGGHPMIYADGHPTPQWHSALAQVLLRRVSP